MVKKNTQPVSKSILVIFHSQEYGNTAAMAAAVAEGARSKGAEVRLVNTNETRLAIDSYRGFDAVAFGSPDYFSYVAGGLKVFLDDWYIARKADRRGLEGKPYALFYSHGGGGAVRDQLEDLFERMGWQVGQTLGSRGAPTADRLDGCRELGRQLAEAAE
jgi:flavorubredoxin